MDDKFAGARQSGFGTDSAYRRLRSALDSWLATYPSGQTPDAQEVLVQFLVDNDHLFRAAGSLFDEASDETLVELRRARNLDMAMRGTVDMALSAARYQVNEHEVGLRPISHDEVDQVGRVLDHAIHLGPAPNTIILPFRRALRTLDRATEANPT